MNKLDMAFERFIKTGGFIEITRQFPQAINYKLSFELVNARISLLDTGVLVVEPKNNANVEKDLVISSGIHGNETAPIEIVNQLVQEIILSKITVRNRMLFIIGNPIAMNLKQRFEKENLNRLFCGKHQKISPCYESERAEKLERYVSDFFLQSDSAHERLHYDLHTAIRPSKYQKFAIYPYQNDKAWNEEQLEFLQSSDISTVLLGHAPSGTFSYYSSSQFQAHAFTVELGKVMPFGQNDMISFQAITNNLRLLIENKKIVKAIDKNKQLNVFKVIGELIKESDDFVLHLGDDVCNFTDFPVGTLLSTDGEEQYKTTQLGESIVFPNANVAKGQRAGLMVAPTKY